MKIDYNKSTSVCLVLLLVFLGAYIPLGMVHENNVKHLNKQLQLEYYRIIKSNVTEARAAYEESLSHVSTAGTCLLVATTVAFIFITLELKNGKHKIRRDTIQQAAGD